MIPNLGRNSSAAQIACTNQIFARVEAQMNLRITAKLRMCAAVAGSSAVIALVGLGLMFTQNPEIAASGSSGGSVAPPTTPPAVPVITKAVPTITGPAPLYAGEAPDSNPQAA